MKRKIAFSLIITGLLLLTFGFGARLRAAETRKPNILIIVSDDHGYGDVGAYGCKDIPTPHMDSLAKNGVRFTSGYVSGPYCSPTRAGLMTGRYQTRFGHEFNPGPAQSADRKFGLPLTEMPLPQRLKDAGYKTGMVGKWHLGNDQAHHPLSRGFDEFFGFLGGAHSYVNARADGGNPILRGREPVDEKEYLTDAFRREALAFLDRHAQDTWFLYLAFNAVHGPMDGAARYADRFPNLAGGRKTYATMLTALDDAIGAVLAKLREQKLEEDTLILFVSDNGGPPVNSSSNGPLRGQKAQCWEGGIRVPLMAQWKGQLAGGTVYGFPAIQLDFHATALAAAGVEVKPEWKLDGVNLLPFLTGEKTGAPHDALYWRFGQQMAIRMGDWKLVKAPGAGLQGQGGGLRRDVVNDLAGAHLYNLAKDLGETTNLAGQEPEKFKQLADAWEKWNAANTEPLWFPGQRARRQKP
ncbi:MAG: sulfatase-like hydrolase/transferase [Verrucomicrobia bacterium]|nr:sulfatase-like hydrolase/transferase [Verrucomicrobiota bacterium]